MFASTSCALKLHEWADGRLRPLAVYRPSGGGGGASGRLAAASWSHDGGYVAVLPAGGRPQIVCARDRTDLRLVHTVQASASRRATALAFKRLTKRTLAVGGADGEVVLYDTKNRTVTRRITTLGSPVRRLDFNSTDDLLAVATDRSLHLLPDATTTTIATGGAEHPGACSAVAFHPSCPHLVAAGTPEGAATLRDVERGGEAVATWRKHSAAVTGVSLAGSAQGVVITSGLDHKVCVFDPSSAEMVFRMSVQQPVTASALAADDVHVAVGLEDGHVYVYDLREPLQPLAGDKSHSGPVTSIAFERSPPPPHRRLEAPPSERVSAATLLADSDYGEGRSELAHSVDDVIVAVEDRLLDGRLKRELLKSVKTHVGYLEGQLAEHCAKFQLFVNNEFDAIHGAMARWDVFNVADTCDGVAEPVDAKTVKSTSNK